MNLRIEICGSKQHNPLSTFLGDCDVLLDAEDPIESDFTLSFGFACWTHRMWSVNCCIEIDRMQLLLANPR